MSTRMRVDSMWARGFLLDRIVLRFERFLKLLAVILSHIQTENQFFIIFKEGQIDKLSLQF